MSRGIAKFDCNPDNPDEISFKLGDVILDLVDVPSEPGWMRGKVQKTGQIGLVPSNYLDITRETVDSSSQNLSSLISKFSGVSTSNVPVKSNVQVVNDELKPKESTTFNADNVENKSKYRPPPTLPEKKLAQVSTTHHKKLIEDEDEPLIQTKKYAPPPIPPKPSTPTQTTAPKLPSRENSVPVKQPPKLAPKTTSPGKPKYAPPPALSLTTLPVPIPKDALKRYKKLFDKLQKDGCVGGTETRQIWMKSKLSPTDLAWAWSNADGATDDGQLSLGEWCLGLYLIDERLRGYKMPEKVVELVHSLWHDETYNSILQHITEAQSVDVIRKLLADMESSLEN